MSDLNIRQAEERARVATDADLPAWDNPGAPVDDYTSDVERAKERLRNRE